MKFSKLYDKLSIGGLDPTVTGKDRLNMFVNIKDAIKLDDISGEFVTILGMRGGGKSVTASVEVSSPK